MVYRALYCLCTVKCVYSLTINVPFINIDIVIFCQIQIVNMKKYKKILINIIDTN